MEVNNANYDLGMTGDLNMTEHLNQTTKPSLLVNKPREDEEHNEIFRETAEGEKGAVIEEIEDDTDTDGHGEWKEDNEAEKIDKENEEVPHCKCKY